jgi:2-C-methyl-D-erythritol 4-phosphate cytidylyltransferase
MNIGVILAAGKSTRFDSEIPKQLYPIGDKPMVQHSIDLLSKYLDEVIIVTNSDLSDKINGNILINDIDSRLESIKVALNKIDGCNNILIHDAARPFITDKMIEDLLESSTKNLHSQFYLPLVNGLAKKSFFGYEVPNREDFIELCSPQITNFDIFKHIFNSYIETGDECEILPIVSRFEMKYNLIQGHYKYLRKITTLEDIY